MKIATPLSPSLRLAVAAALGLACSITSATAQTTLTYDADTTAPANDGAGVWNTTSANWYNGTTDVLWTNGLTDTAIFGVGGTGGAVTVGTVNVGTIQFNATTTTAYTLSTGTITLGTGIVNNNAALGSTISAKISGTAGLAFSGTGTGTVSLNGANDYTGVTTLTGAGSLTTNSANSLGSSAGATANALGANYTQVGSGTTVRLTAANAEAFVINGNGTGGNQGALRFVNPATLSSFIQLGSNSTISGAFSAGNVLNGNLDLQGFTLSLNNLSGTINGVISGTGSLSVGSNVNPLNLTNTSNSFSGTLTVGAGTVGLGANGVLGTSTLVFNNGIIQSTDGTARTVGNTIGTFTGNATFGQTTTQTGTLAFTSTTTTNLNAAARTFTTNVDTSFANGFSGTGNSGITKAGAATLTLNGASTYTGGTIVNAGTLLVNNTTGSGTGTGSVTVNNTGSVLGGTGLLTMTGAGVATINTGSTLAPGTVAAPGILSIGGAQTATPTATGAATVNLLSGSNLTIRLNGSLAGTGYDQLNVTGTVALGGGNLNLSLTGFTPTAGQKFVLINNDGSDTVFGTFSGLADGSTVTAGGQSFTLNYNAVGGVDGIANDVVLTSAAVPEPTTWMGMTFFVGLIALIRLKRRAAQAGARLA